MIFMNLYYYDIYNNNESRTTLFKYIIFKSETYISYTDVEK